MKTLPLFLACLGLCAQQLQTPVTILPAPGNAIGGEIRLRERGGQPGNNYTGWISPPILTTNPVYELPGADGTAGQALVTDGNLKTSWSSVAGNTIPACASTTGDDDYICTVAGFTAYSTSYCIVLNVDFANVLTATINISGVGPKSILRYGGSALVTNDILVNAPQLICYDGTVFQLPPSASPGSGAFLDGGNTFGATATLGTNDNFNLVFERNNVPLVTLAATGIDLSPTGLANFYTKVTKLDIADITGAGGFWDMQVGASFAATSQFKLRDNGGSRALVFDRAILGSPQNDFSVFGNIIPRQRELAGGDVLDDATVPNIGSASSRWLNIYGSTLDVTVSKSLVPSNSGQDLGSGSGDHWLNLYVGSVILWDGMTPESDLSANIGNALLRFDSVYSRLGNYSGLVTVADLTINTATPAVVGYVWTATSTGGAGSWQPASGAIPDPLILGINNTAHRLQLTHPDDTSATWDGQPLAAIFIDSPPTPTTRNFLAGIWVNTNAASQDKGRGIGVHNHGQSDGIIVIQDGPNGAGEAIITNPSATNAVGMVIGITETSQVGLVVRQELSLLPGATGNLVTLEANGAVHEMMRVNSTLASQAGLYFRMTGANAHPFIVENGSVVASLDSAGNYIGNLYILPGGGFMGDSSGWITMRSPTGVGIFNDYGSGGMVFRNLDQAFRTDMLIDNSGNVGIGGTPAYRLHITGGTGTQNVVGIRSPGSTNNVLLVSNDAIGILGTFNNLPLSFFTDSAARWRIDATGMFHPEADNTYDIGLTGTRVRTLYGRFGEFAAAGTTGDYVKSRKFEFYDNTGATGASVGSWDQQCLSSGIGAFQESYCFMRDSGGGKVWQTERVRSGVAVDRTYWYTDLLPDTNLGQSVGSSSLKWQLGYFNQLGDGSNPVVIYGGNSEFSALTTPTLTLNTASPAVVGECWIATSTGGAGNWDTCGGFSGAASFDIIPTVSGLYVNGTTSFRWGNVATNNIDIDGTITLSAGTSISGDIRLVTNNAYSIGNSTIRLANVATVNADFSGTITPPSGVAGISGTVGCGAGQAIKSITVSAGIVTFATCGAP